MKLASVCLLASIVSILVADGNSGVVHLARQRLLAPRSLKENISDYDCVELDYAYNYYYGYDEPDKSDCFKSSTYNYEFSASWYRRTFECVGYDRICITSYYDPV